MTRLMTRFVREQNAQDLIEYALLSALLALVSITAALQLAQVREFFVFVGEILNAAI
jgi:Flp pilus assembly pilin Flp